MNLFVDQTHRFRRSSRPVASWRHWAAAALLGAWATAAMAENLVYNASGQLTQVTTSSTVAAPVIVAHPASAVLETGVPLALAVNATGSGLTYQWYKGSALIPDATGPTLVFPSIATTDAGSYTVKVTNSGGFVTSSPAVLSFPPNVFDGLLGTAGTNWATGGTTLWHAITDAAQVRVGGNPVIGTGRAFQDNSFLQGIFTVAQPSTVRFWMRLPSLSEPADFANQLHPCFLNVQVNGSTSNRITSSDTDAGIWKQYQVHLPTAGTFTVTWQHEQNGYVLLDDVTLSTAPDTDGDGLSDDWENQYFGNLTPLATDDSDTDANTHLVEYLDSTDPTSFQSRKVHLFVVVHGNGHVDRSVPEPSLGYPADTQTSLLLTGVPDAGQVLVGWQDDTGYALNNVYHQPLPVQVYYTSKTVHAWFEPVKSLAEGADTTAITWTTGGDAPWVTQSRVTSDGTDAVISGLMPVSAASTSSWIQATMTGPAKLTFEFSNYDSDSFILAVDGLNMPGFSGSGTNWNAHEIDIPPGTHVLRWTRTQSGNYVISDRISALDRFVVTPRTDTDNDGMADEWEMEHFNTLARDGSGDFDNDGVTDLVEQGDFTNPTQSYNLRCRLQLAATGSGTVSVTPQMASYVQGTQVQITATPAAEQTLMSWSGVTHARTNPLVMSLYNPMTTVTANFGPAGDLSEAVDNSTLTFTNSIPGWTKTTATTHDGVDAAQCPAGGQTNGQQAFTTTVTGPHVLAFWWRLDKQEGFSALTFSDSEGETIFYDAQSTAWQRVILQLAPGEHVLGWSFARNDYSDTPSGAWIDQIMNGADSDQDGIPDAWETTYFGSLAATTGAADSDSDGNSNQLEWADGTNPTSAGSALFRLAVTRDMPGSVVISPVQEVYLPGTQVTLTADASFTGWSGDATGTTNPLNLTMSGNKTIVADFQPLSRAVDATKFLFSSGPLRPWTRVEEPGYGHVGEDAAISAADLLEGQESSMQTTFTGGGVISFTAHGRFSFTEGGSFRWLLDNVEVGSNSGAYLTQDVSFVVPAGSHTLKWIYHQGADDEPGMGVGAVLDNLVWTPLNLIPLDVALDSPGTTWSYGSSATPSWIGTTTTTHDGVDAAESYPLGHNAAATMETTINPSVLSVVSFWWKVSSEEYSDKLTFLNDSEEMTFVPPISGEQDWVKVSFEVPPGPRTLSWTYSKDYGFTEGQDRAWVDQLTVAPVQAVPLVDALDNPALTWTTSTGTPWRGTTGTTHDGEDAGVSGTVTDGQTTWVQTQITGPGVLTFWWKMSGATWDYFDFTINGTEGARPLTDEAEWQQVTVSLPAGTHVLRWSYSRDAFPDPAVGQDKAWLDQVTFASTAPGFGTWSSSFGLSGPNAQPGANPTQDGIPNLLKYAFNLAPNASIQGVARHVTPGSGTSGLPSMQTTGPANARRLRLEYVRRRNATDLTYTVQFGSGLTPDDWSAATGTPTVTIIDATWERVVIEDTVTSSTSDRRFGRVQVSQNP